jgi:hypothetical protein
MINFEGLKKKQKNCNSAPQENKVSTKVTYWRQELDIMMQFILQNKVNTKETLYWRQELDTMMQFILQNKINTKETSYWRQELDTMMQFILQNLKYCLKWASKL